MTWFAVIAVLLLTAGELDRRRRLSPLARRACAGRAWRRSFPDAPANDLREFLRLFVAAFALGDNWHLRFRPDDRVLAVYEALNPRWAMGDSLELESFEGLLEQRYEFRLGSIWRDDLTLGDVFARTRA